MYKGKDEINRPSLSFVMGSAVGLDTAKNSISTEEAPCQSPIVYSFIMRESCRIMQFGDSYSSPSCFMLTHRNNKRLSTLALKRSKDDMPTFKSKRSTRIMCTHRGGVRKKKHYCKYLKRIEFEMRFCLLRRFITKAPLR